MGETVENRVGEGRVTDDVMPLVGGKLAGHDRGAHGVAVLEDVDVDVLRELVRDSFARVSKGEYGWAREPDHQRQGTA